MMVMKTASNYWAFFLANIYHLNINNLCTKISKSLFCMNRVKNFVTPEALKMLYYAMVHSHLNYCINVYSCANATTLHRLKLKHKEAIRIICNAGYRDHTNPLFKLTGTLPLENLVKYSNIKFMNKFMHNKLPFSFSETWITNRARIPNLELRNVDDLYIPPHNFATTKCFPLFSLPRIWNEEPVTKFNPSLKLYLKSVKSAMINAIVVGYIMFCPPPSPFPPPFPESSIYTLLQLTQIHGSRLMGSLDVNMAFWSYSSCPLLSLFHQALALASKAPDLNLANGAMSMYCVLYEFCCYSRPFNSTVVMPYPYVNYIMVEENKDSILFYSIH
jgi:hypothetical protein